MYFYKQSEKIFINYYYMNCQYIIINLSSYQLIYCKFHLMFTTF